MIVIKIIILLVYEVYVPYVMKFVDLLNFF